MKKQKKMFIILLIILALFIAAYFIITAIANKKEKAESEKADSDYEAQRLCVVDVADITEISYYNEDKLLEFYKDGDSWLCKGQEETDLNESYFNTMTEDISGMSYENKIQEPEALSEYGLDKPVNTVTVKAKDKIYTFYLGTENPYTYEYYIKVDGDDCIYTLIADISNDFVNSVDDMMALSTSTNTDAE